MIGNLSKPSQTPIHLGSAVREFQTGLLLSKGQVLRFRTDGNSSWDSALSPGLSSLALAEVSAVLKCQMIEGPHSKQLDKAAMARIKDLTSALTGQMTGDRPIKVLIDSISILCFVTC